MGAILFISFTYGQEAPPQAFSYKAVIKKGNSVVANQAVGLRVSILKNPVSKSPVYVETFHPTTNVQGQIVIELGRGDVQTGIFSQIPWSSDEFFLLVEADVKGGTNYQFLSETQLLSVPYSLFTGSSSNLTDGDGDTRIVPEQTPDDDTLRFYSAGLQRLQITPSGNFETFGNNSSIHIGKRAGLVSSGMGSVFISEPSGFKNTTIGFNADVTVEDLTNATAIGNGAKVNASNKIVLGNASAVTVGGYGTWTNYSDLRLKENIVYRNEPGLNFITRLRPVSYNFIDDQN